MTYKNGSNSGHRAVEIKIFNKPNFPKIEGSFRKSFTLELRKPITKNWPHWEHGTIQHRNFSCTMQASYMPRLIPNKKISDLLVTILGFFTNLSLKKGGMMVIIIGTTVLDPTRGPHTYLQNIENKEH